MKKLFITTMLFWSSWAQADWSVVAGSGSYMGDRHLGLAYQSENGSHQTDFTYGKTPGILGPDVDQLNLKYIYSPFRWSLASESLPATTNILGIGFLLSRWQSSEGFLSSPSQYPEDDYYSPTRYRTALVLSHQWVYKQASLYFDWVLLDQVGIALYNNDKYLSEKNAWSGGFGFRWNL